LRDDDDEDSDGSKSDKGEVVLPKVGCMLDDWKKLHKLDSLPLMRSGYSIEADMRFGWRPNIKGKVMPIPLLFDLE